MNYLTSIHHKDYITPENNVIAINTTNEPNIKDMQLKNYSYRWVPTTVQDYNLADKLENIDYFSNSSFNNLYTETIIIIYDSQENDVALFRKLTNKWYIERGVSSSLTEILLSPSYQRIIGMGERAVPLIIKQLEKEGDNPDDWFWALKSITGENPVPDKSRGKMREMAKEWIELAYKKGWV